MTATLIIPVSTDVNQNIIDEICAIHKQQPIALDIHISYCDEPFSLAKARNAGVKKTNSDWLIFNDIDTVYDNDLFEKMVALNVDVVAGISRTDVQTIADISTTEHRFYQCAHAPLLIKQSLFESVGGYCEEYIGWGYEDSQLENKLPPITKYDSKAYHIMTIHNLISTKPNWGWGSDKNRALFDKHMLLPVEERIRADKEAYDNLFISDNLSNNI